MAEVTEARLLARALEGLAPDERERVTAWLLERTGPAGPPAAVAPVDLAAAAGENPAVDPAAAAERQRLLATLPATDPALRWVLASRAFADPGLRDALGTNLVTAGSLTGEHQVVPVRLPAELHARLREWCAAHGFAMATVIRGLTARFLDSQPEAAPDQP